MRRFGGFLILMAVGSAVLPFLGLQFILMTWVDTWGPTVGWIIRAALLALGILLIAAGGTRTAPARGAGQPGQPVQPGQLPPPGTNP